MTSSLESTRRRLTKRQADTVRRLAEATLAELRETGYADLTVRNVAARAGVAPATAYTYFSSKNHLVAEVFWRRLHDLPSAADDDRAPVDRVGAVLRDTVGLVVAEPEFAAACTAALLGTDPDVAHLRVRVGLEIRQRLEAALGPGHRPAVLSALEFAWAGALMHAGSGVSSYAQIADGLVATAEMILKGAE
ncbi:TetR/AcrR family transcriptional regulator [Amycolatopsis sp. K13G38]|uniref:TetR/AcrR family transcriptional regulator n=1 Tax=Amycolatopsis acididurans TaxID=2724524 RepID=A0ABX1J8U7_9PSEU|nr:TetR/AcrR family transcriptional regulator [Amycolatopsis acididurans]NKQ56223.1 TetR/AcrR family transcriptional regulator [Amycolatopsis acididurans]